MITAKEARARINSLESKVAEIQILHITVMIEEAIEKCEYNVVVSVDNKIDAVMKHLTSHGYAVSYYCDMKSGYYRISWR